LTSSFLQTQFSFVSLDKKVGSLAMLLAMRLASSSVSPLAVSASRLLARDLGDHPDDEDKSEDHGIDREKTKQPS
jgi:hypothetical protein